MDRKGKVPLHRVIDWEPWEISAVPIPFDAGAQIRSACDLEKQELYECMVTRSIMDKNEVSRIRMRLAQETVMMAR
ncbi:hypothetical protein D3C80_1946230 [compost metagenome]